MQLSNTAGGKRLRAVFRPLSGLDLTDPPDAVDDAALSDACNVWDDGASVRLRPGLREWLAQDYGEIICVYPSDGRQILILRLLEDGAQIRAVYGFYIVTKTAVLYCDGEDVTRVPAFASYGGGKWSYSYSTYRFQDICVVPAAHLVKSSTANGRTMTVQGCAVYLFGGGTSMIITPDVLQWPLDSSAPTMANVFAGTPVPHVPTIRTGTPPAGGGTAGEARNLLTPKVTQAFTTDAAATVYQLADTAEGVPDSVEFQKHKNAPDIAGYQVQAIFVRD